MPLPPSDIVVHNLVHLGGTVSTAPPQPRQVLPWQVRVTPQACKTAQPASLPMVGVKFDPETIPAPAGESFLPPVDGTPQPLPSVPTSPYLPSRLVPCSGNGTSNSRSSLFQTSTSRSKTVVTTLAHICGESKSPFRSQWRTNLNLNLKVQLQVEGAQTH